MTWELSNSLLGAGLQHNNNKNLLWWVVLLSMNALIFIRQVWTSRWFVIAAGIWIQSAAGTAYTFGVYSQSIKLALNYDQQRLDTLAFFKTIGGNVGIISGLVYDVVPPWAVLVIGAAQNAFGYTMLWLAVTARIAPPPLWQMCIYICVATNSATFFSTAVVVTNVKNFPNKRGIVIGLLKGFLGLSGAILTQTFYAVYQNNAKSFLLMVSWLPSVIALLFMTVIRSIPVTNTEGENVNFSLLSILAVCLAAYLMGVIILDSVVPLGKTANLGVFVVMMSLLLLFFGVVVRSELKTGQVCSQSALKKPLLAEKEKRSSWPSKPLELNKDQEIGADQTCCSQSNDQSDELVLGHGESTINREETLMRKRGQPSSVAANLGKTADGSRAPERGEDHTLFEALSSLDFWLLLMAMTCSMGSGTTAIDNMGQIGASLGYAQVEVNTFISLISIWNFLGRFGAGLISELLLHSKGISRPLCLALSLGVMCLGHLVMASALPGSLYVGSIIVGLCYGAQWSLMPAITSEIFGLRHFGTLFNTIGVASPIGAYFMSVRIAGYLYDIEAKKEHDGHIWATGLEGLSGSNHSDALLCHGAHCFRLTFIILACVCVLGCGICLWLLARTRLFYLQLHERMHGCQT